MGKKSSVENPIEYVFTDGLIKKILEDIGMKDAGIYTWNGESRISETAITYKKSWFGTLRPVHETNKVFSIFFHFHNDGIKSFEIRTHFDLPEYISRCKQVESKLREYYPFCTTKITIGL